MARNCFKSFLIILLIQAGSFLSAAENYEIPRTQWGHPDLQGVWNFASNVPMERQEEFGDRQFLTEEEILAAQRERFSIGRRREPSRTSTGIEAFYNDTMWMERARTEGVVRTSLLVYPLNGRLPERVEGIEHHPGGERDTPGERPVRFVVGGIGRDGPEDRGLSERCLVGFNAGPQLMPSVYNNNVQIVQNKDQVVIFAEMVHDARIVNLSPGPELDKSVGLWSGDSRGYWDGDTLVVTTKNFNGLTQSFEGYGSSKNKILTERFTRVDPETINYEFTIEDPSTFKDKLTAVVTLAKVSSQLYEYACHEGNYGMGNMLRAARNRDATEFTDRVREMFRDR
ncbi:MAG: hypothetical protein OXU66_04945 [Gammaproteobacteria bacterium]|nr:hypothetical protein [Gammaproteobacteria bacterium]MDD9894784.1 hypothetical protein [Gammaproteobacteria bacterium]MDD9958269.1 hypothetical protein [Gammaproteobacteria bacterium]